MNDLTPAPMGHNAAPLYDPEVLHDWMNKARDMADAAGAWLDLGEIEDEAQAEKLTDFVSGATKIEKGIEEARKAAKEPHATAAKAVDEVYRRPAEIVARCKAKAKELLTGYLQRKKAAEEAERRRLAAEAQDAFENAAKLAAEATARNDIVGEIEAKEAREKAEALQAAADRTENAKVASYTGAGRTVALRTVRKAEIINARALFAFLQGHPEMIAAMQTLADRAVRAGKITDETATVCGVRIIETQVAA